MKPDDYSRHEVLHVLNVVANLVTRELLEHQFVKSSSEISRRVKRIHRNLSNLYQTLGEMHLGDEREVPQLTDKQVAFHSGTGEGFKLADLPSRSAIESPRIDLPSLRFDDHEIWGDFASLHEVHKTLREHREFTVKALAQAPSAPAWWDASLNRRATVEQWMFDAARGKRPMPTPDELRAWALKLGTPEPSDPTPRVMNLPNFKCVDCGWLGYVNPDVMICGSPKCKAAYGALPTGKPEGDPAS